MNPTYQVVGADGQVYGPVSLEDLKSWVKEGRLNHSTQIHRSDQNAWQPASAFPELELVEPSPTAAAIPVAAAVPTAATATTAPTTGSPGALAPLLQQTRSGAGWFHWIAGLSLVNTIASLSGSSWGFILGLGITQVFDAVAGAAGGGGKMIALVLDALVLGMFVFFGYFAGRRQLWAFLVGMVLYALDGLIFVGLGDWMAVGFHALALFFLFKGFQACRAYNRLTAG